MTDRTRERLTKEEAEKKIKQFEELSADLDKYIAEHWTGGDEDGKTEA